MHLGSDVLGPIRHNLSEMTTETTFRPNYPPTRLLLWFEMFLCAVLGVILAWKGLVPAWNKLNTDFPNYYLVARLLREGYSLDRVYDWIWLQRIKDHWGLQQPLVGFTGLTPFSALPVLPLTFFSALTAKRIWIVLNLFMLAASVEMLHRLTMLRRSTNWLVALLAIVPLCTSFLYGQMHLAVLFLMVTAYVFFRRKSDIACGVTIALAGALKIYPLCFFGYLLLKRRWRGALAIAVTLALLLVFSYAVMGREILHDYIVQQLPRSLRGEVMDPYNINFASGSSLLHRLLLFEPDLNPHPLRNSPTLYSFLYPLWQLVIATPLLFLLLPSDSDEHFDCDKEEWAALLIALITLSPIPSTYHFVVLILPVTFLVDSMVRRKSFGLAGIVTALYICISLVGAVRMLSLVNARLWLLITLYLLSTIWLWRIRPHRSPFFRHRELAIGVALVVGGFTFSVMGYRRHFAHHDEEMRRRLPVRSSSYLVTSPAVQAQELFFVGMTPGGYRILKEGGQAAITANTGADQLSFAIVPHTTLLLETADARGSHLFRTSDGVTLVDNAESPAVSHDGRTIAYIREAKGRGTLRETDLSASYDVPLTDESYDVREAGFLDSSRVLFSARHNGRISLFVIANGTPPSTFFSLKEDIGTFGISPDSQRIAFTLLARDHWKLAMIDVPSHQVMTLTEEDCNAYLPMWRTPTEILYATDCGRGAGLSALSQVEVPR